MADIHVNFVLMNGENVEIEVPEEMIVEDALEQLVEAQIVPALDATEVWQVSFKETGKVVDIERSMAQNGIKDGTAIRVAWDGQAG